MNYAGILAGGIGERMEETAIPKQFLLLEGKPIIIYTVEEFLKIESIDEIIIAVPVDWIEHTKNIINKYCKDNRISIIQGGKTRNDTIMAICEFITKNRKDNDDIIITHDAVRPFVTPRIIMENIEYAKKYDAVDTVIPATDTIVEAKNNDTISNIPVRKYMYLGQTPQTFKVKELIETYKELSEEQKEILTDAAKIYVLQKKNVKMVQGEPFNIKITTKYDLKLANLMIKNKVNNNEVELIKCSKK